MLTDLIGGQLQVTFDPIPSSIEYVRTGRLRALAVTTATRCDALPDIPPVGDFVAGFESSTWYGVGAPRNTPSDAIIKLNTEINNALADPKLRRRLTDLGDIGLSVSSAEFAKFIGEETEKWGKVVKFAGMKAE
jgi:tripartite-type tricarboxylate transporter receptor subunit TctC